MSFFFFFFQAEDGIRDFHVTGVQTCALPISPDPGAKDSARSALADSVHEEPHSIPSGEIVTLPAPEPAKTMVSTRGGPVTPASVAPASGPIASTPASSDPGLASGKIP